MTEQDRFVTEEIIQRGVQGAEKTGACVIGMPSKDTVKIADIQGYVAETPDRSTVWTIQTPQIFEYRLIREAHEKIRCGICLQSQMTLWW